MRKVAGKWKRVEGLQGRREKPWGLMGFPASPALRFVFHGKPKSVYHEMPAGNRRDEGMTSEPGTNAKSATNEISVASSFEYWEIAIRINSGTSTRRKVQIDRALQVQSPLDETPRSMGFLFPFGCMIFCVHCHTYLLVL